MRMEDIIKKIEETEKKIKKVKDYLDLGEYSKIKFPYKISNPEIFFTVISLGSAQEKSPEVEKFIAKKLNWEKISPSLNKGDFYDKETDTFLELKVSFPNKQNCLNFRQVRLWQEVDYICIYINENNILDSLVFYLTHEEMSNLMLKYGSATHGTKKANAKNTNIEYSYSLNLSNALLMQEWKEKYFSKKLFNKIFEVASNE